MLLTPVPMFLAAGGMAFPEITMNAATIAFAVGYVRSGSYPATLFGSSGGTISDSLVSGLITDGIYYNASTFFVYINGDYRAELAAISAVLVDSSPYTVTSLTLENGMTRINVTGNPGFTNGNSYTIQLTA